MKKQWEHSLHIEAPAGQVFELVADFNRHAEWNTFTRNVVSIKAGGSDGVGAEWKVYERLGLFYLGAKDPEPRSSVGLAKYVVREVAPGQRIAWHSHAIPHLGISADFAFEVIEDGAGCRLTQSVTINVPGVVETLGRLVLKNLDTRQQGQWLASLENLKAVAEGARIEAAVAV